MIIDIYTGTKKTEDGQFFALTMVDEPGLSYTFIKSLGSEPFELLNAEIIALENATALATRFAHAGHIINIFHSLDKVIDENSNIRQGNVSDDAEKFYCAIESMVLENIIFLDKLEREVRLIKVDENDNLTKVTTEGNDLGYFVDIDDLQITDADLAEDYLNSLVRED